jgi:hypothetical protein
LNSPHVFNLKYSTLGCDPQKKEIYIYIYIYIYIFGHTNLCIERVIDIDADINNIYTHTLEMLKIILGWIYEFASVLHTSYMNSTCVHNIHAYTCSYVFNT